MSPFTMIRLDNLFKVMQASKSAVELYSSTPQLVNDILRTKFGSTKNAFCNAKKWPCSSL